MKKNGILNSHIAKVLADLGHTDTIVIADCGLPIPIIYLNKMGKEASVKTQNRQC